MIKTRLCLLFALILASGCTELVVNTYEGDASVYFYHGQTGQTDSISYSFFYAASSAISDTVWVDVRLTGLPTSLARPISLAQIIPDSERDNDDQAVPDIHYLSFAHPDMAPCLVMPANKVVAKIPVVLLHDASLQHKEYRLWIELGNNEHFAVGVKEHRRLLIKVSDLTVQPSNWNSVWRSAFGTWSVVKMKFIIDYVGVDNFDIPILYADMSSYLNQKAKKKLSEYEAINGELLDETGSRITFPTIY